MITIKSLVNRGINIYIIDSQESREFKYKSGFLVLTVNTRLRPSDNVPEPDGELEMNLNHPRKCC